MPDVATKTSWQPFCYSVRILKISLACVGLVKLRGGRSISSGCLAGLTIDWR